MAKPTDDQAPRKDLKDAGEWWAATHGHNWAWDTDGLIWRHWTATHWEGLPAHHSELDRQAMEVLRSNLIPVSSPGVLNGIIRAAAPACSRPFPPTSGIVNFINGTLTWDGTGTATVGAHHRGDGLTYCLPYAYTPTADHPAITRFLAETIPDPVARAAVLIHCGLALLGDTRVHQMLLLLGPPRSGKSTILELCNAVCGQMPMSFAGPSLFGRDSEGLKGRAGWAGHRLVAIDEMPVEALQNEGLVKIMAAHGGVEMRRLYQAQELNNQWRPKLILNTNDAPRYADRSGALTARLVLVRCPYSRVSAPETQDVYLLDKLLPELGAWAATCLLAAQAQLASGRNRYPLSVGMQVEMTEIEQQGDALKSFLAEECVFAPGAFCDSATLYFEYQRYCKENGNTSLSRNKMIAAIRDRHTLINVSALKRVEGKVCRGIEGLRWRHPDELPDPPESVTLVTELKSECYTLSGANEATIGTDLAGCNTVTLVTLPYQVVYARAHIGGYENGVTSVTSVTNELAPTVAAEGYCGRCGDPQPCVCHP